MSELPPNSESAASRLCQSCGMCCNGVMFHLVQLQPADSLKALSALGLKIKRKKGKIYIQQPCAAYRAGNCSIYLDRPQRCRIFECQQLKRLAAAEISEAEAAQKIAEAQGLIIRLQGLMEQAGTTNPKRPLSKRFEKAVAEPVDPNGESSAVSLREELLATMRSLEALLHTDFRIQ